MNRLANIAIIAAAAGLTSQPCLAAAVESQSEVVAGTMAPSAAQAVEFNLAQVRAPALASLSLAASQQTASEAADRPERRGSKTTTWLIVGGVALLAIVVLAVVASATPKPGPPEGAF